MKTTRNSHRNSWAENVFLGLLKAEYEGKIMGPRIFAMLKKEPYKKPHFTGPPGVLISAHEQKQ